MSEWKEYRFSDFVDINPTVKIPKRIPVSFIEMKDLDSSTKFCTYSQHKELGGGSRFINGDTLFARITPCLENGKICQVRGLKDGYGFGSTEFHVFRGKEGVSDSNFVYYLSRSDEVRSHAEHNLEGSSGRQRVAKEAFDNLFLLLPPLEEQKRIAGILSLLDDKIDLLNRENTTLEALAETLFRHYFIDNPNPEWKEGKLGDEFDFTMGQSPSGDSFNENGIGIPMYQGNADFGFRFPTRRVYTTAPTRFAEVNDTLISVRAPVGAQNMATERCCIGRGVAAFRYKHEKDYYSYTYYKIKSLLEEIKSFNDNGTVFGSISKSDFENIDVVIPDNRTIKLFQEHTRSIDEKISNNQCQIQALTAQRDTLLPRLMNGEVKVTE
ncbi:MAG: restriction endonuclease subunit S [Bacteroidales bacterium]|nr:restriction endonuclease subunit S [Bacteroidales bacterium]